MKTMALPRRVTSAQGVTIELDDGRRLIDGISSWWCIIHGYNHPELNQAAIDQIQRFAHVMLGGLTHSPAERLAEELVRITPEGLNHVFFSDSGSVGMEVAMKMAMQYWFNQGRTEKRKFVSLKRAYHGDTTGVMSISDGEEGMHALLAKALLPQYSIPAPESMDIESESCQRSLDALKLLLTEKHAELAAFVVEPIMQGAGGFNLYSPEYLREAQKLCREYDVLFIFDEVATGFGRTGKLFAAEHAGVTPDIMVLGKGLTAGYFGLAATIATTKVFDAFYDDSSDKAFMHGPTFMGQAVACSVALKGIEIFQRERYLDNIKNIQRYLENELIGFTGEGVREARVLGAMGVIEVDDPQRLKGFSSYAVEFGVWLRPFERYLYTAPAYIIDEASLAKVVKVMKGWFSR